MDGMYSDVAPPAVSAPTCRRRDRILVMLRSADEPLTAAELVEHLPDERDYHRGLTYKDLNALERSGFVRCVGHPGRSSAR
jgi:Fe2+ or Zn2+ uptake regulation protein